MTIDRGFLQIWKSLAPGALTPNTPFTPHSAFIDGQLHLMGPGGITSWTQLLHCQFVVTISSKVEILVFSDGPDDGTDD